VIAPDDPFELIERLDADNERLRMKALDLMRLMEDAVTAQVAAERRAAELEAELDALRNTKLMRVAAPARRLYARLRRRSRS
jgi:hypothetical protein